MDKDEQQERYRLIEFFQTVSSREGFGRQHDSDTSAQYDETLDDLVSRYGHEEQLHGYIMLSLDQLQDRKPLQTVRGVALHIANRSCELKMQAPVGSAQAQGYEKLESRVALLWRHLMQQDQQTPRAERQGEYRSILLGSSSQALKAQLRFVKEQIHQGPGLAFER